MYAFGLAVVRLGLRVELTRVAQSNYWSDALLQADVVHYCYGDATWSKRHYFRGSRRPMSGGPPAEAPAGTVLGEILGQIRKAEKFYAGPPISDSGLRIADLAD